LWLKDYEIIATGQDCGLLECVTDAMSLDSLKRKYPAITNSLYHHFRSQYGEEKSKKFKKARKSFIESLAAYSLLCYILQIKDRHNGNILIDRKGHIVHIDFGFLLSNTPGGNFAFEKAPFKLTEEFEMIMGGRRSKYFTYFRALCVKGFMALKRHCNKILLLVEMMR